MIFCIAMVIPALATDSSSGSSLTRGSRFTVTITGAPNTDYYVWLTRTFSLSGNPGDQPPVIAGGQNNVLQDPPDGPYTIGMYTFNGGNGRSIRDDVAPSTPDMPSTNYYALVTTDRDGRAVVAFQTSFSTATRTFSIKAENPQSSARVFLEREVPLRLPSTPAITPSLPLPTLTTIASPSTFPTTSPLPATTVMTTVPTSASTPPQPTPLGIEVGIFAIFGGIILTGTRKFFR